MIATPHRQEVRIDCAEHLVELTHWIDTPKLRLLVPPAMLRMQGGFVYGEEHPFVQALRLGEGVLAAFYAKVQPRTLAEFYDFGSRGLEGEDLPPWELPWYGRASRTPPPGEGGLSPRHGVSFYGPCSAEKVSLEFTRLTRLAKRISSQGYLPDIHGDIEGYVLRDGDAACFFVRGGKHRAAALTALNNESIPVAFRSGFPRIVDAAQSEYWPLVRSGVMHSKSAQEILAAHVAGRSRN